VPRSEATRGVRELPLVTVGFRSLWRASGAMNVNLVPETPSVASLIYEQQDGPSPPKRASSQMCWGNVVGCESDYRGGRKRGWIHRVHHVRQHVRERLDHCPYVRHDRLERSGSYMSAPEALTPQCGSGKHGRCVHRNTYEKGFPTGGATR